MESFKSDEIHKTHAAGELRKFLLSEGMVDKKTGEINIDHFKKLHEEIFTLPGIDSIAEDDVLLQSMLEKVATDLALKAEHQKSFVAQATHSIRKMLLNEPL